MPSKVDASGFDAAGAGDPEGSVFGLPFSAEQSSVVLLPVPWEATTSYGRGTAQGPAAVRAASPQLDLFDIGLAEHGLGQPWHYGIHMLSEDEEIVASNERACARALPVIAAGGVVEHDLALLAARDEVNLLSRSLDHWVETRVSALLARGKIVGVVGGDHSVALGSIAAHARRFPGMGVLHVDAHADLRRAYEGFERSHASVFGNVLELVPEVARIVQVGIRDVSTEEHALAQSDPRMRTHYDPQVRRRLARGLSFASWCDEVIDELPAQVYVSFDIDGLDPALCPGTGTPVPGGFSFAEAVMLLETLHARGKTVVGFDLVEVAAAPEQQWDGNVGARILYKLCGLALLTQGARD
ncbi:MAG: agmatinase family protein [Deltaproteobacteria bacterium]|nr:agmatinase family protein [Nannocystaceae bacterium]